jgi:hypothetical protein
MHEPLLDRIQRLERSNRFWRITSLILAAILLSVLTTSLAFFALAHQRTLLTMEAVAQEAAARAAAEAARLQAERALQEAKEQKKD